MGRLRLSGYSVATKFALFISLATGFVVVVLGVSNQQFLNQLGMQLGGSQMEKTLAMVDPYLQSGFESMYLDLTVIGRIPCIQTIVRAEYNGGTDPVEGVTGEYCQARLSGVLSLVMNARTDYLEIGFVRTLEEQKSLVRQQRSSDTASVRALSDFDFVDAAIMEDQARSMQQGEIAFLSSETASSGQEDSKSGLPTVTVVTPVFDSAGMLYGYMWITGDLDSTVKGVLSKFPWRWSLAFYDKGGNLVPVSASVAEEPSRTRTRGAADPSSRMATFHRDVSIGQTPYLQRLRLSTRIPIAELVVQANLLSQRSLSIAAVLLIVVMAISFAFGSRIVSPLQSLDRAIKSFGDGDTKIKLPVQRNDEFGQIARSFSSLAHKLQETSTAEQVTHQKLQAVFEQSIDSLVTINGSGEIETLNKAAIALFGYQPEEIVGRNVEVLMPESDRSNHDNYISNYSKSGKPKIIGSTREVRGLSKDGKILELELSVSEIRFEGKFVSYCGLLRDISERKASQDKLKQFAYDLAKANDEYKKVNTELDLANDDLRTFTYIVSHDLRAPLVNLQGFTVQLEECMSSILKEFERHAAIDLPEDINRMIKDRVPKATAFISSSTTRMQTQLDAILHVSRLGRFELDPKPVNVGKLLAPIFESHLGTDWQNTVTVEADDTSKPFVDEKAFRIVATNICSNAIKYRSPERALQIKVDYRMDRSGFSLRVEDNGRGIDAKDLHKVFELFRRSGRPDTAGEGVGLTYTKALVTRMGGTIWCESSLDKGTTFYVNIPLEKCNPVPEAA